MPFSAWVLEFFFFSILFLLVCNLSLVGYASYTVRVSNCKFSDVSLGEVFFKCRTRTYVRTESIHPVIYAINRNIRGNSSAKGLINGQHEIVRDLSTFESSTVQA